MSRSEICRTTTWTPSSVTPATEYAYGQSFSAGISSCVTGSLREPRPAGRPSGACARRRRRRGCGSASASSSALRVLFAQRELHRREAGERMQLVVLDEERPALRIEPRRELLGLARTQRAGVDARGFAADAALRDVPVGERRRGRIRRVDERDLQVAALDDEVLRRDAERLRVELRPGAEPRRPLHGVVVAEHGVVRTVQSVEDLLRERELLGFTVLGEVAGDDDELGLELVDVRDRGLRELARAAIPCGRR